MSNVLYVTAHPLDESMSNSLSVGRAFINAYREANPQDEVHELHLFDSWIPQIDRDVLSAWNKLGSGVSFAELTNDEQSKVGRLGQLVDQFVGMDKYVFVSPLWNLSYPPVLKAYLDSIMVAGKTFRYTEQGPIGLLSDKKALHIQSRGGVYSEAPASDMESGHKHLRNLLAFIGVFNVESLILEGLNFFQDRAQAIKEEALHRAKIMAASF